MTTEKKRSKRPNLLYVVTDEGKTVHAMASRMEAWLLQFGLAPVVEFLENLINILWPQFIAWFKDSALIVLANEYWKQWANILESLEKMVHTPRSV